MKNLDELSLKDCYSLIIKTTSHSVLVPIIFLFWKFAIRPMERLI